MAAFGLGRVEFIRLIEQQYYPVLTGALKTHPSILRNLQVMCAQIVMCVLESQFARRLRVFLNQFGNSCLNIYHCSSQNPGISVGSQNLTDVQFNEGPLPPKRPSSAVCVEQKKQIL